MPILSQDTLSVWKSPYHSSYGNFRYLVASMKQDEARLLVPATFKIVGLRRIGIHCEHRQQHIYITARLCRLAATQRYLILRPHRIFQLSKNRRPTSLLIGVCLFLTHAHFSLWGLLFLLSSCLIPYILGCDISKVNLLKRFGPIMSTYHHRFLLFLGSKLHSRLNKFVKQPPRICIVLRTSLDSSINFPSGCLRNEWHRLIHSRVKCFFVDELKHWADVIGEHWAQLNWRNTTRCLLIMYQLKFKIVVT